MRLDPVNAVSSFHYYMWNAWGEEECKITFGGAYKHFWSDPISLNILQIREMWCKVNENFRNRLQNKRHLLEASTFEKVM